MSEVCQQYRVELGHRPIPINRLDIQSYRRVNSPGLPNASLRSSCKGSKKRMEIGLVTDRKLSESPLFDQMLSTGKIKTKLQNECESKTPSPKLSPPKMEPLAKRNLRMIEKLESDQLCLKIYMSEEDQNQLVFTGVSKQKMQSPNQNKKIILQNLQQLFLNGIQGQNQYIKLESLEQQLNQEKEEKQEYHGITSRFPGKRMNTIGHDTKSILDRSLSISTIKEYKSNTSSKINKDIEMIEQGLQKYKLQTKNKNNGKSKKQQPLGQHNCTISLKQKQNTSRSPFLKNGSSPSFCTQRKTEQRGTTKLKQNTKSMHA